jgi:hypothetical protein
MHVSEHNKSTTVLGAPFRLHSQVFVHWLSLGHNMTHPESFQTLRQHLNPHPGNGLMPCSGQLRTKGDLMQIICSSVAWDIFTQRLLWEPLEKWRHDPRAQTAALRQWLAVKRPIFPPLPATIRHLHPMQISPTNAVDKFCRDVSPARILTKQN